MSRVITIDSGPVQVDTGSVRQAAVTLDAVLWTVQRVVASLEFARSKLTGALSSEGVYAAGSLSQILWEFRAAQITQEIAQCAAGLRVAANIYDYTEQQAVTSLIATQSDHMGGLYFQHNFNRAANELYPQILFRDTLHRMKEQGGFLRSYLGDGVDIRSAPLSFTVWLSTIAATQKAVMHRADTALERSAALLSCEYPRIEKRESTYRPILEVRGSNPRGTHLHTRIDRDSYLFGLESYATSVLAVPAVNRLVSPRTATSTPRTPSALITKVKKLRDHPTSPSAKSVSDDSPNRGEFEIERHDTPGTGRPTWSVVVKGTQEWLPGTSNPKDMQSNLALVGRVPADEEAAIVWALSQSGAQPGDAVEFVGHSQGGIVAASLAASPAITEHYTVAGVVTAGSPISGIELDETTPVLAFENTDDIVPALDGQTTRTSSTRMTVYSTGEGSPHDLDGYIVDAENAEKTGHADLDRWVKSRQVALGLTDETVTTRQRYTLTRVTRE